jgi:uncharacterized protein (DUF983 family)
LTIFPSIIADGPVFLVVLVVALVVVMGSMVMIMVIVVMMLMMLWHRTEMFAVAKLCERGNGRLQV